MSLVLAPSEHVVEEWQYATSKTNNGSFDHSLTVTNKRVVVQEVSANNSHHIEIPAESITGLDMSYGRKIDMRGIVLMFIGMILAIVGGLVDPNLLITFVGIGAALMLVGLIIILVVFFTGGQLIVNLYSNGISSDKCIGLYANAMPPVFKKIKRGNTTKVKVNSKVAKEIVDTLGSIILDK